MICIDNTVHISPGNWLYGIGVTTQLLIAKYMRIEHEIEPYSVGQHHSNVHATNDT